MAKILYCVLICFGAIVCEASKCLNTDPCLCQLTEHSFINLSTFRESPKFFQDGESKGISYFFSGCTDKKFVPSDYNLIYVNDTKDLDSVSLVKCNSSITIVNATNGTGSINQTCRALGYQKDQVYEIVQDTINQYQIVYKQNNKSLPSVRLICNSLGTDDLKISSDDTDALLLYSSRACIEYLPDHHLSSGSVFCIIFFTVALIYFVGGAFIMYFMRGARGVEIIPNYDFWASIPELCKHGLVFLLSGCSRSTINTAETYDRI